MVFNGEKNTTEVPMGRPRADRKIARISVSLDQQDYDTLREIADFNDVSAAWLIRRAVADFLKAQPVGQGADLAKAVSR